MKFFAVVRVADDTIADVGSGELPTLSDKVTEIKIVEITADEYNDVRSLGLEKPGRSSSRWKVANAVLVETADVRPVLIFDPETVEITVGDKPTAVSVTTKDGRFTGTLDLGVTSLEFVDGVATLLVDAITPRETVLSSGENYTAAAPLRVTVRPALNHF